MAIEKHSKVAEAGRKDGAARRDRIQMPFNSTNFWMMGACVAMIVIGFALMSGGGSSSDITFNPEIFSTRRLVVGPTIAFLGFLLMAFAIIWTPKKSKQK